MLKKSPSHVHSKKCIHDSVESVEIYMASHVGLQSLRAHPRSDIQQEMLENIVSLFSISRERVTGTSSLLESLIDNAWLFAFHQVYISWDASNLLFLV